MLNDPFVTQQAQVWAQRIVNVESASVERRIEAMFRVALGRLPDQSETERFARAVRQIASFHQVPENEILQSPPVWKDVAHIMFNLKEFIYIR